VKVDLRLGLATINHEYVVLLEIGDVHPPVSIEANAVANAAVRKRREKHGSRCARIQFSDRALPLEIDDIQRAGDINGGSFYAAGIFAGRSHLAALEQNRFRTGGMMRAYECRKAR
jgi:hypothetical protein